MAVVGREPVAQEVQELGSELNGIGGVQAGCCASWSCRSA
jgi:hypothetical protein